MKIRFLCLGLLAILFFTACENFFEQTVEIDVPEHTPALSVTANLSAGDTTLRVYVSHSQGILESSGELVTDATVELFKDNLLFATIPLDTSSFSNYFYTTQLPGPLPADPSEYRLAVSASGYELVEAVQVMPKAVPILSASYEIEGTIDPEGDKIDELTVEFQDPAGEENYYSITAWLRVDTFYENKIYLTTLDPITEEYSDEILLKDDSFDGKKYTWRLGVHAYHEGQATERVRIHLCSISKDKYLFLKSASLSEEANDNPFAEPVIIHNNIEGGYGIFSLEAKSEMVIEL